MTAPLADQIARDAIRNALDKTLVVEAAAGTGKTTALVGRIIEVIRTGRAELRRLVAVTFTEKAAGELKLRLRGELEIARQDALAESQEIRQRLESGLEQLEEAHIGTIHGFCADLLKERPLQAGVDPLFEVATEQEAERLYQRVFDRWLEQKLSDPPDGVRRLLRKSPVRDQGPVDELYRAGWTLIDIRDFETPWEVRPFDREGEIDDLVERALRLAETARKRSSARDYLFLDFNDLLSFVRDLEAQEQVSGRRDYDALEHRLPAVKLGRRKGRGAYGGGVSREELLAEREALNDAFADFRKRSSADRAALLQNELREVVERYQEAKSKRGRLDFLDLLARARDLLRDDHDLRRELQRRFTHIFVDEFQDTDPLQAEILLLLAADSGEINDWLRVKPLPGKLFVVADPKQSIYRFRRADVALYQRIKRQLIAAGAQPVYLSVSFRSVPELQEIVNSAMSAAMKKTDNNHQADYVALERHRPSIEGQPSVIALPIPRPYGDWGYLTQYAMQRSEPTAVASWVRWLIEDSGYQVTSRGESEARPIGPSDVCLLFRRFVSAERSVTQPYVEGLQGLDVPHVLVGGRGFHQREEIEAMRIALTAIERPDDELAVFSTLRGPLFSLADDSLFLFRSRHGPLHAFRRTTAELRGDDNSVQEGLDELARLHKGRNFRPIALTIRELLDATRAQAGFALWQAGDQVLANVLRLMQLARNFEESAGLSFRGFINHLSTLAETAAHSEQPLMEDGVEGVRLMTVHKAKGLEFPVVVLCDITCNLSMGASRHLDPERGIFAVRLAGGSPWELLDHEQAESERDAAESLRLLYVAATRARDILAVPVVADRQQAYGWVAPLLPALYPSPKSYRFPMVAPSVPRFTGEECVIERPSRADVMPGEGIRPGLHKPSIGGHEVVWWDPHQFEIETATKPGLRRYWILQAQPDEAPTAGEREHQRWTDRKASLVAQGAAESFHATSVSRLVEEEADAPRGTDTIEVAEVTGRDPQRPGGKRFGSLVHELLARSPWKVGAVVSEDVEPLSRSLARMLDATEAERDAAVASVLAALAHPILMTAKSARECYRETPLIHRDAEGRLIEGIPDLVFRESPDEPWTVVDFKTDLRIDMSAEPYRRQVAHYLEALESATRAKAKGLLLYV
jgi:ATP-dependent exoDNAse (exonuclease V) beta subunit